MQRVLNNIWCRDGPVRITSSDSDLFIIQLTSESTRQWILEYGPWHVLNRPVVIRKWEYGVTKLELDLSKFPIYLGKAFECPS